MLETPGKHQSQSRFKAISGIIAFASSYQVSPEGLAHNDWEHQPQNKMAECSMSWKKSAIFSGSLVGTSYQRIWSKTTY